jgi:hypothetical protein
MLVDFSHTIDGLTIGLHSLSTGYDTCQWSVLYEGTEVINSTDCDFEYIAGAQGFYIIKHTITSGASTPPSMTKGIEVYLRDSGDYSLLYSIIKQVDNILPGVADVYWEGIERYKVRWQLALHKALSSEAGVVLDPEDIHDETKWPYAWNTLISQLISRDIILDNQTSISGVNSGTAQGGGMIKKIVTGPTEAEWHSSGTVLDAVFKDQGLFSEITKRICAMGEELGVTFSFCESMPFIPTKLSFDTDVKTLNKLLVYGSSWVLSTFYE